MTKKQIIESMENAIKRDLKESEQYSSLIHKGFYKGRAEGYEIAIKLFKGLKVTP